MNSNMIKQRSQINSDLIEAAEVFFGLPLTKEEKIAITSLSYRVKKWLLEEYTSEIKYAPADLSSLY
jgi:hypothetical protein